MYKKYGKPIFDIIITIFAIPLFLISLIIFSPLIYLEDKGPVFYISKRLVKNGKLFNFYKFRSMKVNAPDIRNKDGSTFNSEKDPRLTVVGKLMRETSIDELPQIINVINKEMSFIGPRPDLPEQYVYYKDIEKRKLIVLPGVTGYNQALYRNSIPWNKRKKNDLFYVNNINFFLDLYILIKTLHVLVFKKEIYIRDN